jgi:hypothetical protein
LNNSATMSEKKFSVGLASFEQCCHNLENKLATLELP